jgi:outer membrane autotransporter protein
MAMILMTRRNGWRWTLLGTAMLLAMILTSSRAPAADLNVDATLGNSPFNVGANITFTNENVGTVTTGVINQGAFTNTVSTLNLGQNAGSSGTYNLSGSGILTGFLTFENIGGAGNGTFIQTGGTNSTMGFPTVLSVGGIANASGTYILSNGTLAIPAQFVSGVNGGSGTFTQSGGGNTCQVLYVGLNSGGSGAYSLSGFGTLSVGEGEVIGNKGGSGTFTQTGGTHFAGVGPPNDGLVLGSDSGGSGTYNLSGGSLTADTQELIGNSGSGAFTQSGGTNTVTGNLILGNSAGGSGTYTLSGGSLTALNETIGNNGIGFFTQTGGTNAITGNLSVGAAAGSGTYALLGGSATVGGNYTQGANGTFAPGIASPSNFAKLVVTGNASLTGTLKPLLLGGFKPGANQLFPGVISATGGVTGTFSTLANQFISPILSWQALYTANTVDLLAKADFSNSALNLTHNQYAVGVMLNGVANGATGDLGNVLNTLANLPSNDQVANAYQQISPDKAAALPALAFAESNLHKRILSQRISNLRFGSREIEAMGGLPGSFNLNCSPASGLMLAYNSSNLAGLLTSGRKAGQVAPESRWGVYLDPVLVLGSQASTVNQTGFNFSIAGFNAGADYRVRDDLLVGLATGYSYTGARFQGSGGSVQANTWPLTAYVAYLPQSFYAYGSLGYALNLFNLERNISFGDLNRTAKSSTTGNQLNTYGEAGYDLKVKRLVVTPVVSLAYSRLWVGGFTEDGADSLNLRVSPQNAQSLQTGVGGKIALPMKRNSVVVVPQVYATYQHEYSNSSRGLDARLSQAGSTFTFQSENPHRNFAVVGANVNILTQKNLKVQLDYNAEVGRGNSTAHYVSAGVRWEF